MPENDPADPLLQPLAVRPDGACKLLGIRKTTLYELLAARELDSYTVGRARCISTSSIAKFIERRMAAGGGA
jgi:excisionase family DNA binding protein